MSDEQALLEAKMTPDERSLFELFKSRIGQEFDPDKIGTDSEAKRRRLLVKKYLTGYDSNITLPGIRRWAVAVDDYNPLWFDEQAAQDSGWHGFTAPPLFIMAIDDGVNPASWLITEVYDENNTVNVKKFPNFMGGLQGSSEFEFNEPIHPGDTITFKARCTDIYWKQGKSGRLLFTQGETDYINQSGRVAAVCRQTCVYRFK